MAATTLIKNCLNRVLSHAGLRLESLTAERRESSRLKALHGAGYFDRQVFPGNRAAESTMAEQVLSALPEHKERFETFASGNNEAGFCYANSYYSSPDADVLYTLVRLFRPRRIAEVGSGNSTRLFRQAIRDGGSDATLVSIDPCPRTEVAAIADRIHRCAVEELDVEEVFSTLGAGDILFIDSSHELKTGNDCAFLFLRVLPCLKPGVIVHVHDVYLPYEYPIERPETRPWTEQYLLQAFLDGRPGVEVLWASHHLFRTRPELLERFPHARGSTHHTCAFWFRVNHA